MKPIIPPELWDGIIDNLHDDNSTLCICSLVCRFWLWSSRAHLFYTIVLWPSDIDTAISFLCAPGSTIPPHVRALEIEEASFYEMDAPRVINTLPKLPQLPAVEKLSLYYTEWHVLTPEAKECLFTISRGVKSLTLEGLTFDILDQALQLISSAPSLECLSLGNMDFHSTDTSLTKFRAPPIKHLVFKWSHYTSVIIDWLFHWQPTPSIRNLAFGGIRVAGIPSIAAYIRRLGPALEHLELAWSGFEREMPDALRKEFDLTHSTSLKTISIKSLIFYNLSPPTYDWIIDVLSKITSRFIERVALVIVLNTLQELNLPALAVLFARGNSTFSELSTRLQFDIYGGVDKVEARAAITKSLHELDSQGRLEFGGGRIPCLYD